MEIEDHPILENLALHELGQMIKGIYEAKKQFGATLGVNLRLEPTQILSGFNFGFVAPVYTRWLGLLLQKLIDIELLIASGNPGGEVLIILEQNQEYVYIKMQTIAPEVIKGQELKLFTQYFADLGDKTNLKLGSGLEGFIAKTIATKLDIPLIVAVEGGRLIFQVNISKYPRI